MNQVEYDATTSIQTHDRPGPMPALSKLTLRNAGKGGWLWDWLDQMFGEWGSVLVNTGINALIVLIVAFLLACCIVPILRRQCRRTMDKQTVLRPPTGSDDEHEQPRLEEDPWEYTCVYTYTHTHTAEGGTAWLLSVQHIDVRMRAGVTSPPRPYFM